MRSRTGCSRRSALAIGRSLAKLTKLVSFSKMREDIVLGIPLQPGEELASVGVVEAVEDRRGLAPCPARHLGLPRRVLGVAEMGEGLGFVEAIAELPEQAKGTLITRLGLSQAA